MSSAGGRPSWQKMVSVGTSIVPPGHRPPPEATPDTSSTATTSQVTASHHDFAVSLDLRCAGKRVCLDYDRVEALDSHRRAVALGAVTGNQPRYLRSGPGSDRQWIGIVNMQHLQLRASLPDASQQPLDRIRITVEVREEACLLAEPEVPDPGLVQLRDLSQHVGRIPEPHQRALDWLVAERAEPAPR